MEKRSLRKKDFTKLPPAFRPSRSSASEFLSLDTAMTASEFETFERWLRWMLAANIALNLLILMLT
jgi:hypothetical protein